MPHFMQGGSRNIRQDDIDPDTMTYEVGRMTCINFVLIYFSTLKLFASQ